MCEKRGAGRISLMETTFRNLCQQALETQRNKEAKDEANRLQMEEEKRTAYLLAFCESQGLLQYINGAEDFNESEVEIEGIRLSAQGEKGEYAIFVDLPCRKCATLMSENEVHSLADIGEYMEVVPNLVCDECQFSAEIEATTWRQVF